MQTVSEVMTRDVQFVTPQETIRRAAQLMDDLNVGALPVCEDERVVGMVTDRDITVRATSAGLAPEKAVVDQVMSTDVRWCFEDQLIEEVMRQMAESQVRRVPVLSHDDAQRLVGIVALGDIATKADEAPADIEQVVERVSSPSMPDRSPRGGSDRSQGGRIVSDVETGAGLAGSDVLDAGMNAHGASSTGDPSEVVEVGPEQLANRNAPGATRLERKEAGTGSDKVIVRRTVARGDDTSSGESGAPEGIDAASPGGGSGGTAGTGAGARS